MNTSAHVSLDSDTKLKNLMIATEAVINQLKHEGRLASEDNMITAHYYMGLARNQYGLIDATEGATND